MDKVVLIWRDQNIEARTKDYNAIFIMFLVKCIKLPKNAAVENIEDKIVQISYLGKRIINKGKNTFGSKIQEGQI